MGPKILVISNEAFSDSGSNSRTMKNLLINLPKKTIAQFYLHGIPDRDFCGNYFRVSDGDSLNTFLGKKKKSSDQATVTAGTNTGTMSKPASKPRPKPRRSYRNLVLRNLVWQSRRWWKSDFTKFYQDFQPDIVLLQAGDAPFMYAIARQIANACNARLMMYNSESYVLKRKMYANTKDRDFWHFWLMRSLKYQYRKFMKQVDYCIYSLEALEAAYQAQYPHPGKSCSLYTVSEMEPLTDEHTDIFRLLYCGNLGVGRDQPLAELAQALYSVDKTAVLDIYGKFTSQRSKDLVCQNPNVCYHGLVDYREIPGLMCKASMLVHCENSSRLENLRYAFSTKIADSIASTRPFLVYASREYPFVQYLEKYRCAHIAENREELQSVLKKCMDDLQYCDQFAQNAQAVAAKNHNQDANYRRMTKIFDLICPSSEEST